MEQVLLAVLNLDIRTLKTEMWRSARSMPVKNEKPTTMEATDSSNVRENKCETIPVVIRRRRKKGGKRR